MLKPKVRLWRAQLAAVLLTLLAFAFTVNVLGRIPEGRHPLLVLLLASALSAAYGGLIAGVVSTFLGVALVAYVYEPAGSFYVVDPQDQTRIVLLALLGIVISVVFAALQKARREESKVVQRLHEEVAARDRIERSLTESRDSFELLAASVPEIVFVATTDGQFEFLNSRWTEFTGLPRDLSLGTGWRSAVHADDLQTFDTQLVRAIQLMRPLEARLRLRSLEGVYRTALVRASPSRRSDGSLRWFGSATDIEDVARTSAALRASEERLKAVVAAAELGTFVWDATSDDLLWSDRARRILGITLPGPRHLAEFVAQLAPSEAERVQRAMHDAIAQGEGHRFRTEIEIGQGSKARSVLVAGVVTEQHGLGANSRGLQCVGAVLDRSRERSTAAQVARLETSLQLAIESTRLGIWDVDLATDTISVSARAREIYGLSADGVVTRQAARSRILDEDLEAVEKCWRAALDPAGQGRFDVDHRVRRADGSIAWVSALGRAHFVIRGSERVATRIAGTVLDISDRKQAEQRLAAQEEQFLLAAEALAGLIYSVDLDTGRVERLRGLYDILGWERDEVPATYAWWQDQVHGDDLKQVEADFKAAVAARERRVTSRYRARHRSGHWRHLVDCAVVMYRDDGVPYRLVGCVQDVSEQVETTRSLVEADERKDRFLAVLAHELRNPIAPLRNAVSILRTADFERPELLQSVEILDRQLLHATRLVDDLLDVGRIGRGSLELRKAAVRFADVVQTGVEAVRPAIEERGQQLKLALTVADEPVLVDPVRIAQVIANLVGNASKFSPPGGSIEVTATTLGSQVQITVEDHGKGIPPTALSTIFEMFAQLDRGNAEASEGLGIGLALSRHLVELHGGQIRAYSEGRGTGARFVVTLPVQRAPVDTAPSARGGETRALKIVVADDNVDSVESLAVLLTLDGHHVSVAHDGLTAVQLATDTQPDLAILDLGMPGIDGYEAAERMRALPGGGDLVLVALSGYAQAGDRQRSQQAGFDLHLVKPLDPERLRDLLAAVVTGRAGFRDSYAMGT